MSTFIKILIAYELVLSIPIKHSTAPSGGTNEKLEGLHPPLGQCHCEPQRCEMQQQYTAMAKRIAITKLGYFMPFQCSRHDLCPA
jgi:hypothetical protein